MAAATGAPVGAYVSSFSVIAERVTISANGRCSSTCSSSPSRTRGVVEQSLQLGGRNGLRLPPIDSRITPRPLSASRIDEARAARRREHLGPPAVGL